MIFLIIILVWLTLAYVALRMTFASLKELTIATFCIAVCLPPVVIAIIIVIWFQEHGDFVLIRRKDK